MKRAALAIALLGCTHPRFIPYHSPTTGPDASPGWSTVHCDTLEACNAQSLDACPTGYDVADKDMKQTATTYGNANTSVFGRYAYTNTNAYTEVQTEHIWLVHCKNQERQAYDFGF